MARRGVFRSILEEGGEFYYIEREVGDKKYLHCRLKNDGCPARGYKTGATPITLRKQHFHAINFNARMKRNFRQTSIEASYRHFLPVQEIYESVSATNPEAAALLPFYMVRNVMSDNQKRIELPNQLTFGEFCQLLSSDRYKTFKEYAIDGNNRLNIHLRNCGNNALIIYAPDLASSFQFENLHVSSTKRILPELRDTRLMTYVTAQYHNYLFPIAFILWTQRSLDLDHEVMLFIKDNIVNNVTNIYTDFDLKLTISSIWPQSNVVGTFDSFCRILYQEAFDREVVLGLDQENFLKKCMSIILVPGEIANELFLQSVDNLNEQLRIELYNFITYFDEIWIQQVGFNGIQLYQRPFGLNKASVIYWKKLVDFIGSTQPTTTLFLSKIILLMNNAKKGIECLQQNHLSRLSKFPRVAKLLIEKKILNNIWQMIHRGEITRDEMLDRWSVIIEQYYNDHVHNTEVLGNDQLIQDNNENINVVAAVPEVEGNENAANGNVIAAVPEVQNNEVEEPLNKCQICMQNIINMLCIPCGHVRMCRSCSNAITMMNGNNVLRCPFCNEPAEFRRAYLP